MKNKGIKLVKIITDEDGYRTGDDNWHLSEGSAGSPKALCTGQVYGCDEGPVQYSTKVGGNITCPKCKDIIKFFKSIQL